MAGDWPPLSALSLVVSLLPDTTRGASTVTTGGGGLATLSALSLAVSLLPDTTRGASTVTTGGGELTTPLCSVSGGVPLT